MARRSDFTEHDWEAMQRGVGGAALILSVSDRGVVNTFKEARALAKHLGQAQRRSSSQLVSELATMSGTGFGFAASREDVERETLEALRASVALLEAKAPDEVDAYRSFVIEVAESVAGAAKDVGRLERLALDLAGAPEDRSGGEDSVLERIRTALGAGSGA
jgi:hypothetical protein